MASEAATADQLEEEQQLVEEAQRGNLQAMRPLFERYASPLYATVILPRLGNAVSAEEVLRDTLATAVEKIHKFRWQGKSIYPWLRQIAVNKVYDVHRRSKRTKKLVDALAVELPRATAPEARADAQLIIEQERVMNRARIDDTLEKLSDRYRLAIRLRLIEELPREECAQRMEINVGNFDVVLFRAVRAFRKRFGER
ncbi:RNA polymerase, sigma-24 subunit, ECF subfamily [Haliangium ochraceum DSM 14365]|uniref:RNA polymerase, sigma-24 subunit, ECF subfamily n=2 Tax=Haliangium ochraceum TaxID=80816 RepID=D0LGW8_HALO1|nr:RNA polymerase, sigma-24 subunit, ECF subfamily [Haliangium ochraceum DSM 14365]